MRQKGNPIALTVAGYGVLAFLLLLIYMATNQSNKKVDNLSSKIGLLEREIARIQVKLEGASFSSGNGPVASEERWLNRGTPFPLTPDPYFANMKTKVEGEQEMVIHVNSDEKGFNRILENAAQVGEWHDEYVNDWLGKRHWKNSTKWSPHLAERIEISEDKKEFTIYLRKGVRWHRPLVDWSDSRYEWLDKDHYVTSHDFLFAYTTIMNNGVTASFHRDYYKDIESFEIIDDHTYTLKWKQALYTNIPYTMQQFPLAKFIFEYDEDGNKYDSSVFAQKFNNHWYNNRMMGCGPYRFVKHVPDQYTEFERNEFYYGFKPALSKLRYTIVKDDNTAYIKLKGNEVNLITRLPESVYRDDIVNDNSDSMFQKDELVAETYTRMVYYHVKWNNMHPIFRDKMVRRAMTHALNREAILRNICMGLGEVCIGGIPPNSPYYNKNLKPHAFDLRKAREILEQQGWKDEDGDGILEKMIDGRRRNFEFKMDFYSGYNVYQQMYGLYREDLLKIGVKMNLNSVDWPILQKKYEDKSFEAIHGVWLTAVPIDFYQIWHSDNADVPKSSNSIRFKNKEVDDICQKMREAMTEEERIKLAHRMQEIWYDEQPYTFQFFRQGVAAFTPNIQNRFIRELRPHILVHPYFVAAPK